MRLKYEPSSEPLHISVKQLFLGPLSSEKASIAKVSRTFTRGHNLTLTVLHVLYSLGSGASHTQIRTGLVKNSTEPDLSMGRQDGTRPDLSMGHKISTRNFHQAPPDRRDEATCAHAHAQSEGQGQGQGQGQGRGRGQGQGRGRGRGQGRGQGQVQGLSFQFLVSVCATVWV